MKHHLYKVFSSNSIAHFLFASCFSFQYHNTVLYFMLLMVSNFSPGVSPHCKYCLAVTGTFREAGSVWNMSAWQDVHIWRGSLQQYSLWCLVADRNIPRYITVVPRVLARNLLQNGNRQVWNTLSTHHYWVESQVSSCCGQGLGSDPNGALT